MRKSRPDVTGVLVSGSGSFTRGHILPRVELRGEISEDLKSGENLELPALTQS